MKLDAEPSKEAIEGVATLTLAFTRVSRSVRQLVALEQEVAGLRDPHERKRRERRNADSAKALRLMVGGLVKERIPGANPDYLKGLLSDSFRADDDYDDYERGDMGPIVERICQRFRIDNDPAKWPSVGPAMTADEGDELDKRIMAELDLIAERGSPPEHLLRNSGANGHDPP